MAKYLAVGFWYENQDFSISRVTDSEDPIVVSDLLTQAADFSNKDSLQVVLLIKNGESKNPVKGSPPQVVHFWRAESGDFIPPKPRWIVISSETTYWNSSLCWRESRSQASRFDSPTEAMQSLLRFRNDQGDPIAFTCGITIEPE